MTTKLKKLPGNYYRSTPIFWRKLGDALLGVTTMITVAAEANDVTWLVYTALGIGVVGKFLTNFFADSDCDGIADIQQEV